MRRRPGACSKGKVAAALRTLYLFVILIVVLTGTGVASWGQVSPDDPGIPADEEPVEPQPAEPEPPPPATPQPPASAPTQVEDQPPTAASVRLEDVTWTEEGQIGKLTIRTDAPVNFRAFAGKSTIAVDLWRAHNAEWRTEPLAHAYARRLRIRQYTPELARIYIDLKRPARYKTFVKSDPYGLAVLVIPPWMATTKLPPSVAYQKIRVPSGRGSSAVHILRVDPSSPDIVIRPVLAGEDVSSGTETTSVIATRYDALAGINGGYFAGSGRPLGMIVIDGQLVSAPLPRRSVFAISNDGRLLIQAFEFQGHVITPENKRLWVSAVNRPPHAGGVAVYTSHYGPLTPYLQTAAVVRSGIVQGYFSGRILIPQGGYVLTVNQSDETTLTDNLKPGQRAEILLNVDPGTRLVSALGGGPRLVKEGKPFVPFVWEWFTSALFATREPRTAVGIMPNGKLIFVTVDGRSKQNTGMTLTELARLMVHLGAFEAMNLDGGSSATMVVGGRMVNEPSSGEERAVGSALLILRATR